MAHEKAMTNVATPIISHTTPMVIFFTQKNQSSDTKSQVIAKIKQPVLLRFMRISLTERNHKILFPALE